LPVPVTLIPRPQELTEGDGEGLTLTPRTRISATPGAEDSLAWLRRELGAATGFPFAPGTEHDARIRLSVDPHAGLRPEGYRLIVDDEGALVVGHDPAGVFYGAQTLRQLLPADAYRQAPLGDTAWVLPALTITDARSEEHTSELQSRFDIVCR